jgi:hypothetical protein
MELIDIKKELYKNKTMAKFDFYESGDLYYTIELSDGTYLFPVAVVNKLPDIGDYVYELSSDIGNTRFYTEVKGSELIRWISMAFDDGKFIKIK